MKFTAASTFAGELILGSIIKEITLTKISSMPKTGLHRSVSSSISLNSSFPGGCKIEMQTVPSG